MTLYVYATNPTTETVHLVLDNALGKLHTPDTLCGRVVGSSWEIGDETESGLVSTCGTCKREVRRIQVRPAREARHL